MASLEWNAHSSILRYTGTRRETRCRMVVRISSAMAQGHIDDPLHARGRSHRRTGGLPLHRLRPVESGAVRRGGAVPRRHRQPLQGAVSLGRPAVPARPGRRRAVPGHAARLHALAPPARRLQPAVPGAVDGHRDGNRLRQDRVLPLSGARPLPRGDRGARRQGHRHLPHERAGVGSGATNRRDRPPHAVAARQGDGGSVRGRDRIIAPPAHGSGPPHREPGGPARTASGHPAHQLQDARPAADAARRLPAVASQRGRRAALSGGGRAAHVRRRARDGSGLPRPAAAGAAPGGGACLRRHVRHHRRGRGPVGHRRLRVRGVPPAVRARRRGRRGASGDRRVSRGHHHQRLPRAAAGARGADGPARIRLGRRVHPGAARGVLRGSTGRGARIAGMAPHAWREAARARLLREPAAGAGRLQADPRRCRAGAPATQPSGVRHSGRGAVPACPVRTDLRCSAA